jgi:hypothetical protein
MYEAAERAEERLRLPVNPVLSYAPGSDGSQQRTRSSSRSAPLVWIIGEDL